MKVHTEFHTLLLELSVADLYRKQMQTPLTHNEVDGEEVYNVEEIFNCRICWKRFQYLVKWSDMRS